MPDDAQLATWNSSDQASPAGLFLWYPNGMANERPVLARSPVPGPLTPSERPASAWDPLREPVFRALWLASLVSNVGTWMQNVGGSWLMTTLSPSPLLVALMQTATSLPVFLVGLPAGTLADLVDRRRLLLVTQTWMLVCAGILAALTFAGLTTPLVLLLLTFGLGLGATANNPAWQATTPEVVSRARLPGAIALNGAGFNLSRAVGPALGGIIVASVGPGANFLLNAVSFLGTIVVLYRWRRQPRTPSREREGLLSATRAGLRYVRHAPDLRVVLARSGMYILGASALWALLPLVARQNLGLDATGYGILVGSLGVGAVGGAVLYPRMRARWTADQLVPLSIFLFAVMLLLLAWVPVVLLVCVALGFAGIGWMATNSSFQIAVQTGTPGWVRARAIGVYLLVFQGGLAIGSGVWGVVAEQVGNPLALSFAAAVLVVGVAVSRRLPLREVTEQEVRLSTHLPPPRVEDEPAPRQGPVLVTAEFRVEPGNAPEFVRAMRAVERVRRRDGAVRWGLFHDPADPERYLETFLVDSWVEHQRQHERTTEADRAVEQHAYDLTQGGAAVAVSHLVAADADRDLPAG